MIKYNNIEGGSSHPRPENTEGAGEEKHSRRTAGKTNWCVGARSQYQGKENS